jgi:hypothetical protein
VIPSIVLPRSIIVAAMRAMTRELNVVIARRRSRRSNPVFSEWPLDCRVSPAGFLAMTGFRLRMTKKRMNDKKWQKIRKTL